MQIRPDRLFVLMVLWCLTAFTEIQAQNPATPYLQALVNAQNLSAENAAGVTLTTITPQNKKLVLVTQNDTLKVLVVKWVDSASYRKYYNNGLPGYIKSNPYNYDFVTAAPDLLEWYKQNRPTNYLLNSRLEELLGLPPNYKSMFVVEILVPVQALFRPCKDTAITRNACSSDFTAGMDSLYKSWWINKKRCVDSSGNHALYDNYPFTGIGYTYDWNSGNTSHIGLSEFCIKKGTFVFVRGGKSTAAYFNSEAMPNDSSGK